MSVQCKNHRITVGGSEKTANLCLQLFKKTRVKEISVNDVDIARRVPATKPSNRPNAVVCKFARPQAKEKVMTGDLWNEIPYEYKDFLEKSLKKETSSVS